MLEFGVGGFIGSLDGVPFPAPAQDDPSTKAALSGGGVQLAGYATRYLKPHAFKGQLDAFRPGCFDESLAAKSVIRFTEDHNETIATTEDGLELCSDSTGLAFLLSLPNTLAGARALDLVRSSRKRAMSVGYKVLDVEFKMIGGERFRLIQKADLRDIAIVRIGAVEESFVEEVKGRRLIYPPSHTESEADARSAFARLMTANRALSDAIDAKSRR